MTRHVAIVGFMASGKSTIGRKLARRLGAPFLDTDALVIRAHGPIAAIFADEGEAAFRRYERAAIGEALETPEASVVALGGGALTQVENRKMLYDRAYRVFIKLSPEQILSRVRRSREVRPVLGPRPTLATVKTLYEKRLPEYAKSDYTVEAERRSDRAVIDDIVGWLREKQVL
ncbi:MAG TPA: shikimate kinase [Candidatus Dormibacteraeota bacterium]|jgi:shikimate kinase|nr:shikimate kinase [Candidatus Dormibacteraeota bacterium]